MAPQCSRRDTDAGDRDERNRGDLRLLITISLYLAPGLALSLFTPQDKLCGQVATTT